jgi:hypothetical protein
MKLIQAILTGNTATLTRAATGFTLRKKAQRLVATNNYLDLGTLEAYSYDWWCYFRIIDGVAVFNDYNYSPTTNRHQRNMHSLLRTLGIRVDVTIRTRESMGDEYSLIDSLEALRAELVEANEELLDCKRLKSGRRDRCIWNIERIQDEIESLAQASRRSA